MALNNNITSYQVYLSSHIHNHEWQANIILRDNNMAVIDLRFVADPGSWVSKGKINATGVSIIYAGMDRYSWFLDVLRNETPLVAVLYSPIGTVPPRLLLQTGPEPSGESEVA